MNFYKCDTILVCLFLFSIHPSYQIDKLSAKVYGPGLDPINIVLPARYITIELEVHKINKTEHSAGIKKVEFKAKGYAVGQNRPCRLYHNLLDRKDGSYIARYKLYEACTQLQLIITADDVHVEDSPYTFGDNIILPESCYCPKHHIDEWLDQNKCGTVPEQITMDLQYFNFIDWNQIRSKVINRFNKPESISICHYMILKNKVYRKCYGKHVGFNKFMDNILLSLTRKMQFPDMEFFVNLGDWPLVKDTTMPVFSWCGSEDTYDIVMPTYDITQSTLENMGGVSLDMLSVQGNTEFQWEERIEKVFWRGRDSNPIRLKLIDIARTKPDLFNVSMTNFFFYRNQMDVYGPKSPHISFYKFFDYKYQISIDGTVAAYRLPYLLTGGSLVLKQTSKYYEHFYHLLKPNEHYIPISQDLSDLLTKLNWSMNNDEEAKQIAQNAKQFANNYLLPKDIYCYHGHLFNEYSKLLVGKTDFVAGMEEVTQPNESQNCHCQFDHERDEL